MNLIAIDIGNRNIKIALYVKDEEKLLKTADEKAGNIESELIEILTACWDQVPLVEGAADPVKDGVVVASSVKPEWTETLRRIVQEELGTKLMVIGVDVPLPIETAVDDAFKVGTDRLTAAAAAYAVVEDAVIVADFGTAVTVDLVDEDGVFVGGTISPGFELSLEAMHAGTAKLPIVKMQKPKEVYGTNTEEAMRAGVYWAAVGLVETVCRKYAEQLGKWPQVIMTGGAAKLIKDDCDFVDSWVGNLALRGIIIAYKKYLFEQSEMEKFDEED